MKRILTLKNLPETPHSSDITSDDPYYLIGYITAAVHTYQQKAMTAERALYHIAEGLEEYNKKREESLWKTK